MGQIITAFADRKGTVFRDPESTTVSDLCALLGNLSVARDVLARRTEIEAIWAEHDEMLRLFAAGVDDGKPVAPLT